MNEITEIRSQLQELIHRAKVDPDPASLRNFRQLLFDAVNDVDKLNRQALKEGAYVEFTNRDGEKLIGSIDRINTNVAVLTILSPPHHWGRKLKVSFHLLTPTQQPEPLSRMTEDEAMTVAARACGAPAGGHDFTAKHVATRYGKHLIFVDTPARGYFVVVNEIRRSRIVGEEDSGIRSGWVTEFFGVDRDGQMSIATAK